MRNLTFKQLRTVNAIAQLGTVTAAAQRLNLSVSAVSITLKQLEEDMGIKLFNRTDQGFKPTEAGHEVILADVQINAILEELAETTSALRGGQVGHVAFGVVSTAKYFAPFLLRAFELLHPKIEITLRVGNRQEILARLTDFSLDMALIGRPPQDFEVEKEEIGLHPHVVIAAPDHPLALKRHVAASRLSDQIFLVREPGSGTRLLAERILSEIGAVPKPGMEISSNETIKQAVMAGLGISMLSYHTVAHEIEEGRLVILRVEGTPVVRKWYVVRHKKKHVLPSALSLWKFVAEKGGNFLPPLKTAKPSK
jgi:LysR family transcriptional regulator, low CO2-responsive transcriptional regulator